MRLFCRRDRLEAKADTAHSAAEFCMFHGDAADVGSVALLPLGPECQIGFLGIGSVDKDRFHPGMSIDFLTRVADLVTAALSRY